MKKVYIAFTIIFMTSFAYAESISFIQDGKYQIMTLSNLSNDQIPFQIESYAHLGDIAIECKNQNTDEMFLVLIHPEQKKEFDKGCGYGNKNVKMVVNIVTIYKGEKIYEFVKWSN